MKHYLKPFLLSSESNKKYEELERKYFYEKLAQDRLASITRSDMYHLVFNDIERIKQLCYIIFDIVKRTPNEQIIVFADSGFLRENIQKALVTIFPEFKVLTARGSNEDVFDLFNRKKLQCLVVNEHDVIMRNVECASHCIHFTIPMNPEFIKMRNRSIAKNETENKTFYYLYAEGKLDQKLIPDEYKF
jgi:hypothetical protein